jgi:hypothetical protein
MEVKPSHLPVAQPEEQWPVVGTHSARTGAARSTAGRGRFNRAPAATATVAPSLSRPGGTAGLCHWLGRCFGDSFPEVTLRRRYSIREATSQRHWSAFQCAILHFPSQRREGQPARCTGKASGTRLRPLSPVPHSRLASAEFRRGTGCERTNKGVAEMKRMPKPKPGRAYRGGKGQAKFRPEPGWVTILGVIPTGRGRVYRLFAKKVLLQTAGIW